MNIFNNKHRDGYPEVSIQQLTENAHWFLGLGISLVILGVLAVIFSYVTTVLSMVYLGMFMIVLGVFQAIKSSKIHRWSSCLLHIVLSILYILCGLFIIMYPMSNAISFTLLLALFFIVTGIAKLFFALRSNVPLQGWLLFNGAVTLLLGLCIWSQWPVSGLWVIGTLLGIEAMITGWTFIMLSVWAKKAGKRN